MAINFPNSPSTNETYTFNGATWQYNGTAWSLFPLPTQNRKLDDISSGFNGTSTSFTISVNTSNVAPVSATVLLISINGILQEPESSFTINNSTITFTEAPASGSSFFGVILSQKTETFATVSDGSITSAKLTPSGVTADTYGNATIIPVITVDSKGRITSASNTTVSAGITTGKSIAMAIVFGG